MTDVAGAAWTAGSFDDVEADEPYAGIVRRVLDCERATLVRYEFAGHARFPLHRHPQEQITLIERGTIELTVDGELRPLAGGAWAVSAPDVDHGIEAGAEGAVVVAVSVPRRAHAGDLTVVEQA